MTLARCLVASMPAPSFRPRIASKASLRFAIEATRAGLNSEDLAASFDQCSQALSALHIPADSVGAVISIEGVHVGRRLDLAREFRREHDVGAIARFLEKTPPPGHAAVAIIGESIAYFYVPIGDGTPKVVRLGPRVSKLLVKKRRGKKA